uniref:Uncharacterized protein n=1 Tax=Eptatretus burgeri TaxID=7764 RepID=A0A8C4QM82_EPTBU
MGRTKNSTYYLHKTIYYSINQRRGDAPGLQEDPEGLFTQPSHLELSQHMCHVLDMSSHVGGCDSIWNVVGPIDIFSLSGDFTHVAVPRTCGSWWDRLSQWTPGRCPKNPECQDFIELLFDVPVFPTGISVLETYHPGHVVRILAMSWDEAGPVPPSEVFGWRTLWSGTTDTDLPPNDPFTFSPPIQPPGFATNVLRLEFSCSLSAYYMELVAVVLYGIPVNIMVNEEEEKLPPFTNNGYFDILPFEVSM